MPTLLAPPTLERVLQGLHESEIRCGIQNEPRPLAASLHGSTTAAGPRRPHSTEPSLVIGRSGRWPIASRRGCMKWHCAFSLIVPMPKATAADALARRFCHALAEETAGLTPGSWLYSAMPKPDVRALAV